MLPQPLKRSTCQADWQKEQQGWNWFFDHLHCPSSVEEWWNTTKLSKIEAKPEKSTIDIYWILLTQGSQDTLGNNFPGHHLVLLKFPHQIRLNPFQDSNCSRFKHTSFTASFSIRQPFPSKKTKKATHTTPAKHKESKARGPLIGWGCDGCDSGNMATAITRWIDGYPFDTSIAMGELQVNVWSKSQNSKSNLGWSQKVLFKIHFGLCSWFGTETRCGSDKIIDPFPSKVCSVCDISSPMHPFVKVSMFSTAKGRAQSLISLLLRALWHFEGKGGQSIQQNIG